MLYQCVVAATRAPVGNAAPLPAELVGLTDASLADLSAALSPVPGAYAGRGFIPYTPAPTLTQLQAAKLSLIATQYTNRLAGGAPYSGQVLDIDAASRADLGGMAATALAAIGGTTPWPASYSTGWICHSGTRLALPTPQDGIALAASAGNYYAELVQHAKSLADAVSASSTTDAVAAIDVAAGWP